MRWDRAGRPDFRRTIIRLPFYCPGEVGPRDVGSAPPRWVASRRPVAVEGETLAVATGNVGAFSPSDRATAIAQRLKQATDQWEFDPASIVVQETQAGEGDEIVIGGEDRETREDTGNPEGGPRRVR